jgi:transcriptional regulator with XRE-family HTH domain
MTQQDLATISGIDLQQLVRYETGVDRPDAESLLTIAKALNVEVDYFHIN